MGEASVLSLSQSTVGSKVEVEDTEEIVHKGEVAAEQGCHGNEAESSIYGSSSGGSSRSTNGSSSSNNKQAASPLEVADPNVVAQFSTDPESPTLSHGIVAAGSNAGQGVDSAQVVLRPRTAECATDQAEHASDQPEPLNACADQLEYVDLRIQNRTVSPEMWRGLIEVTGREIWTFARLKQEFKHEYRPQLQTRDHVFVGVLYERALSGQHGNGECFTSWGLTDMASPQANRVSVHLRWGAFRHWTTARAADVATRGSIIALMNPVPVVPEGGGAAQLHVKQPQQVFKLGDCPDLGRCRTKSCTQPLHTKDRFCFWCLNKEFCKKPIRIAAGGGARGEVVKEAWKQVHKSNFVASRDALRQQKQLRQQRLLEQQNWETLEGDPVELEKQAQIKKKHELAMAMDNRRFLRAHVRHESMKATKEGTRLDTLETSLVPKLARGLQESDGIEVDYASIETADRRKAERLVALRQKRFAERYAEEHGEPDAANDLQLDLEPRAKRQKLVDCDDSAMLRKAVAPRSLHELAKIVKPASRKK